MVFTETKRQRKQYLTQPPWELIEKWSSSRWRWALYDGLRVDFCHTQDAFGQKLRLDPRLLPLRSVLELGTFSWFQLWSTESSLFRWLELWMQKWTPDYEEDKKTLRYVAFRSEKTQTKLFWTLKLLRWFLFFHMAKRCLLFKDVYLQSIIKFQYY